MGTLRKLIALGASFAFASTALAASDVADGISYDYADVSVVQLDTNPGSETGLALGASYSLSPMAYAVAGYSDVASRSALDVGAGLHSTLSDRFDVFGQAELVSVDLPGGSDSGLGLGVGLRGHLSQDFEWFLRADRVDVGNGADNSLTFGGIYDLGKLGVRAGFTSNDRGDALTIGVRFPL